MALGLICSILNTELHCWCVKWVLEKEEGASQDTSALVLAMNDDDFFPKGQQLLVIACTFHVTSCECERSIRFVFPENVLPKHHARGMTQRLGIALYTHRDVAVLVVLQSCSLRDGIQDGCSCLILSVIQRITLTLTLLILARQVLCRLAFSQLFCLNSLLCYYLEHSNLCMLSLSRSCI